MNILLTNRSLEDRAGSETWVLTMYKELVKNHTVDIFTVGNNTLLPDAGSYSDNKKYDLAIINHRECLILLKDKENIVKKIFTSHGVLPGSEKPVDGADIYVGISEETKNNIVQRGFKCNNVIRNPIDVDEFKPTKAIKKELTNILYISNRKESIGIIKEACNGYNFEHIGVGNGKDNVQDYINIADLVITLGRGCYESLSCNRNVIVLDRPEGDGFVDMKSIYDFRQNNCSGRNKKIVFTVETLREEFKKYDPLLEMREYIIDNNNVESVAKKYLGL